jgi:GcrA cell cycle regulator
MVHKNMTLEWTAKRTEKLAELWETGAPTSEIGRKLKVTKNAVVGKAHRLGLPQRQSPIPGRGKATSRGKAPSKARATRPSARASVKPAAKSPVKAAKKAAGKLTKKSTVKPAKKSHVKAKIKSPVKPAKSVAGKAPAKASGKTAAKNAPKSVAPKTAPKVATKPTPSPAKAVTKAAPAAKTVAPGPVHPETAHLVQIEAPRPPESEVIRLENLTSSMCCWPIGEPGTPAFRFCGKRPTVPAKPYCLEHCMRAFVKSSKDRRDSTPKPVPTPTTA